MCIIKLLVWKRLKISTFCNFRTDFNPFQLFVYFIPYFSFGSFIHIEFWAHVICLYSNIRFQLSLKFLINIKTFKFLFSCLVAWNVFGCRYFNPVRLIEKVNSMERMDKWEAVNFRAILTSAVTSLSLLKIRYTLWISDLIITVVIFKLL